MAKRRRSSAWTRLFERSLSALARQSVRAGSKALLRGLQPAALPRKSRKAPPGPGDWVAGVALSAAGARRYHLYRPPEVVAGERLPLLVMLHGCGQDAARFALSTRMNALAARERFAVLYPEQDRLANLQGCWNWFDIDNGRASAEVALIMKAIDQVCAGRTVDRGRVALAGLSAGASMAALLATRHPERFRAVVMHSGMPPGAAHSALSALGAMRGRRSASALPSGPAASAAAWPPLLVIHGALDPVVAPSQGRAAVTLWADAAGATAAAPRRVQRGQRHAMTATDYKRRGQLVARLVAVDGLGHAWSGGAASQPFSDSRGPDASRMVWAFAARQFRQGAPAPA